MPFERAIRLHRRLGVAAVAASLLHSATYLCRFQETLMNELDPTDGDDKHFQNFSGVVASSCFVIMLLTSCNYVRRNHFELFYKVHIVGGITAFISLSAHFSFGKLDAAAPFLLLMLGDYFYRAVRTIRADATIVKTTRFADSRDAPHFLAIEVKSDRVRLAEPGQYFFVRIPSVARLQWHPFSVSSAPEDENIVIVLKDLGDWTHHLCCAPNHHLPTDASISLDGPYGRLAVPLPCYEAVLLWCGGIGCTPMFGVLSHLVHRAKVRCPLPLTKRTCAGMCAQFDGSLMPSEP